MIKIFDTLEQYNTYTNNGQNLKSGFMYYVKEDDSTHYYTNNIDGVSTIYDTIEPTGNKEITANGENIDVKDYATATVNVPIPEGYIIPTGSTTITQNGTDIDIAQYATVNVNVAAQAKNYIVEGTEYDPTATYTGEFMSNKQIVSANIPSGFTSIGQNAFSYCSGLTSITIPDSVTTIGQNAFMNCTGLTTITIPNGVTSIGNNAFYGCTGLTTITIPNGVTSIGQYAFQNCRGLTTITIPNGVTSIGQTAFRGCTSLTSVTLPNSITRIETETFYQCSGLTSITIPSGMTYIGSSAFYQCNGFTSVTVEATTPPSVFNNSFTYTNNCPIYVPAESVETYKTTGNWVSYASRIQAIPSE